MSITSSTFGKRTYKIVLLGDSSSGKTSLIDRFVNNKFQEKDNPTIGIDFLGKNLTHHNTTCRLQLWDTAGQQRYRSLIPSYLKDAVCALFVFDSSRKSTLENLQSWIDLFRDNRNQKAVLIICGNKKDLLGQSKSEFDQQIRTLVSTNKMKFFQTSALTGQNVDKMFSTIIEDIIQMQQMKKKKILEEDFDAPITEGHLRPGNGNIGLDPKEGTEGEKNEKVTIEQSGKNKRKFCCSG